MHLQILLLAIILAKCISSDECREHGLFPGVARDGSMNMYIKYQSRCTPCYGNKRTRNRFAQKRRQNRPTAINTREITQRHQHTTGWKFSTRILCLTTGHPFGLDWASVIGKSTTKHTRDFIGAWNTTSTCVNQGVTEIYDTIGGDEGKGSPICVIRINWEMWWSKMWTLEVNDMWSVDITAVKETKLRNYVFAIWWRNVS